ncbi:hypothetical protein PSAC2689_10563 [Paraburkholderia sacchari]
MTLGVGAGAYYAIDENERLLRAAWLVAARITGSMMRP